MDVYEVNPDLQEWIAALICILCVQLPISNLGLDSSYPNLFHLGSNESRTRFDSNATLDLKLTHICILDRGHLEFFQYGQIPKVTSEMDSS